MNDDTITIEGYLVIKGRRSYWSKVIDTGKVERATVNKPSVLRRDEIAVKVKLVIPVVCFEPLNLTDAGLVEVPSRHILSPAFFTEEPEEIEDQEGD